MKPPDDEGFSDGPFTDGLGADGASVRGLGVGIDHDGVLTIDVEDDGPHTNLRQMAGGAPWVNGGTTASTDNQPLVTDRTSGGCSCDETELAISKATVGPARVQIVYCSSCDAILEKVIDDAR